MGVSTTAKRGDTRGTARSASHLQHEVIGVVLVTFGLLSLLSLLSFAPTDGVLFSTAGQTPGATHNMIGAAGATVARALFRFIGGAAYLLPLLLGMVAWRCFAEKTLSVTLRSAVGAFVVLLFLSGLLHLEMTGVPTVTSGPIYHGSAGGVSGHLLASGLRTYFASTGAHIILLAGLTISLLLATPISLGNLSQRVPVWGQKMREARQKLGEILAALVPQRTKETDRPKRAKAKPVKINRPPTTEEGDSSSPAPALVPIQGPMAAMAPEPAATEKEPEFTVTRPVSTGYKLPTPLELLSEPPAVEQRMSDEALKAQSEVLTRALQSFGIEGKVTEVHPGPVVTMYEFEPAPGVKVARIVNLADDLALALKAMSLRIVAPLPGKSVVGIEVPNPYRETVGLREVLTSDAFTRSRSRLTLALGKDIFGAPVTTDLKTMPHLLVAGATGAGKSVALNNMLLSVLFHAKPNEVKLLLIDPKMLELQAYDGVPHLLRPVITDVKSAARGLGWVVQEMDRRYKLLAEAGVRNIDAYNRQVAQAQHAGKKSSRKHEMEQPELPMEFLSEEERLSAGESAVPEASAPGGGNAAPQPVTPPEPLPYIVVMIDELADLMMVAPKEVEDKIARLAQMARASGIHLILATQRPSVDVLTGLIKANFPARIAFQVSSKTDSRTILDANGAEALLGKGDMLYLASGTGKLMRLHGCFVSDEDVRRVVDWVKRQAAPTYMEELQSLQQEVITEELAKDEVYEQAKDLVLSTGQASASLIQRRLRVGYPRAARMIEQMQEEGIVSAPARDGRREVIGRKGPVG